MPNQQPGEKSELDNKILACLENHTIMTSVQVAHEIGSAALNIGTTDEIERKWRNFTHQVYNRLKKLMGVKKVKRQSGFFIDRGWKENNPKAYVFIMTNYPHPKKQGDQYQKQLVTQIKDGFKDGKHHGVTLTSAEIVMGYDYDTILIIYADNISQIGEFVLNYLQPHKLVSKTHTVMVWPSEYSPPLHADSSDEVSEQHISEDTETV